MARRHDAGGELLMNLTCAMWGIAATSMLIGFLFWWPLASYSFHYWVP